jgi:phosphatidylglycerophosphatase A
MPTPLTLKVFVARTLASGLGSGFSPRISGTTGTAAALVAWLVLRHAGLGAALLSDLTVVLVLTLGGVLVTNICLDNPIVAGNKKSKPSDPGYIVIDEWAGMFLTLTAVTAEPLRFPLLGFVLFRFFDIIKIGPIAWAERLPRGWGVMLDDVIAGACAAIVLFFLRNVI